MIQPNELRIGNWVDFPKYGRSKINSGAFLDFAENFESIPLTPEILENITGATIITVGCYKIGSKIIVQNNSLGEWAVFINGEKESQLEYKYFHQLQNLYFALTGEELSISL